MDAQSFAQQVQAARPQLLRYARLQLRNDTWAEDVVSATVVAALEKPQAFGGRSQLRTWLTGILKHKLVDCLRSHAREIATPGGGTDDDELEALMFDARDHFSHAPRDWGDPLQSLSQHQFFVVLEACVEQLPPAQGRVFMMREWLELGTDEICKETGLSSSNVWVILHRARLRLRECLELNWFGASPASRAGR